MCVMVNGLVDEKIVLEIRELVKQIDTAKKDVDIFCDLMKQVILSKSNNN